MNFKKKATATLIKQIRDYGPISHAYSDWNPRALRYLTEAANAGRVRMVEKDDAITFSLPTENLEMELWEPGKKIVRK